LEETERETPDRGPHDLAIVVIELHESQLDCFQIVDALNGRLLFGLAQRRRASPRKWHVAMTTSNSSK
jgi:hypothetical protein